MVWTAEYDTCISAMGQPRNPVHREVLHRRRQAALPVVLSLVPRERSNESDNHKCLFCLIGAWHQPLVERYETLSTGRDSSKHNSMEVQYQSAHSAYAHITDFSLDRCTIFTDTGRTSGGSYNPHRPGRTRQHTRSHRLHHKSRQSSCSCPCPYHG
jgi:hypothetical protein